MTVQGLSKRYGATMALQEVSCEVLPGRVTGLLGPNGAGKSTLMRVAVGLDHPTSGCVLIEGRSFTRIKCPSTVVGVHLGGQPWHPRRSARQHLLALARSGRIPGRRVGEVLEIVGLEAVPRRPAGTYSLGMAQRLGLASALLGDPRVLLLDEPVNGLDTDGVRWIRSLVRSLADDGRVVLVSSHLMGEMQMVADQVIVLGRGRLLVDVPTAKLAQRGRTSVRLVTLGTDANGVIGRLATRLPVHAEVAGSVDSGTVTLRITGSTEFEVGRAAFGGGLPVLHLSGEAADLESGYLDLVADQGEYTMREEGRLVY